MSPSSVVAPSDPDARLRAALLDAGLRVTSQRLVLHRVLVADLGRHATAEEVARAAADRLPGLSLPTVYATLELLVGLGLARRVATGGATLFDPRTDPHEHFACTACGRVSDLDPALDTAPAAAAARRAGMEVAHVEVVVAGRCADCVAMA
jgi:Fe2+ or Zn2+ uptake regulation protein